MVPFDVLTCRLLRKKRLEAMVQVLGEMTYGALRGPPVC
jgi:hypothetical protein